MEISKKMPIGVELVRRGVVTEEEVNNAIDYQKSHRDMRLGEILRITSNCDEEKLIKEIANIIGEKGIILHAKDIEVNIEEYISLDIVKECKALPFSVSQGKIKVCFADTVNRVKIEKIRMLLLNKGLVLDKYITFASNINEIIDMMEGKSDTDININDDTVKLVDTIIKTAMARRASDIHFEPMENTLRVRYRIDGELYIVADIPKEKQAHTIGRLKAISNMYQEKQEDQDGRIIMYPEYNIRVSSQKNIYGEKFVLRLLKKKQNIKPLYELGFPKDKNIQKCFEKRNSITVMGAPTGEGKTTSLYAIINDLNRTEVNITTIEDPVEIRIPGLNQVEIDSKTNFASSLRTILRQDPDIVLVGEIRDNETAEICMQAGQTGHYVLSTIHTIDAIEVITRLRKLGVSNYDIASTLATTISQRLVRKLCPECRKERKFNEEELQVIKNIENKYDIKFDLKDKTTYDAVGCKYCNNMGFLDRIAMFEILEVNEEIKELISNGESQIKIKREALKHGYEPLEIPYTVPYNAPEKRRESARCRKIYFRNARRIRVDKTDGTVYGYGRSGRHSGGNGGPAAFHAPQD